MRVIDHHQHRPSLARGGQQIERRRPDRKALMVPAPAETERAAQRLRLRRRKLTDHVKQWTADVEQSRELELGLRLDPDRPHHRHPLGAPNRIVQQRRLADPGLADRHHHIGRARARSLEQQVDARALAVTADEHLTNRTGPRERRVNT